MTHPDPPENETHQATEPPPTEQQPTGQLPIQQPHPEEQQPEQQPAEQKQTGTLRVEGLQKQYRRKRAVNDVSFSMEQGTIVGLLGPNGAGKTTTFYIIAGFIRATSGNVWLNDMDITKKPMYQRSRLGICYLPQEPSVFRRLTVSQNIEAILETRSVLDSEQRKTLLHSLLDELGLDKLANQRADTLSGGERRRTEIGRALACDPQFLLLDEPFSGIDPIAVGDLRNIIGSLSDRGIGVLITDHNVRDTLAITQRAYIINHGDIMTSGNAKELLEDEKAREFYLGRDFSM